MTEPTAEQIDRAAKYLRETAQIMQSGKVLISWNTTRKATKKKWLVLAEGALKAAGEA